MVDKVVSILKIVYGSSDFLALCGLSEKSRFNFTYSCNVTLNLGIAEDFI